MKVSEMAESLLGSHIQRISNEISDLQKQGKKIYNFTVGDFDPKIFPIPELLKEKIIQCYRDDITNYPRINGTPELRESVSRFIKHREHLDYSPEDILIGCGARPIIYAIFQTVLNPGDKVILPVPSWNNNHYTHLARAGRIEVETLPEENFMLRIEQIEPFIKEASLLALCSPQNPTGTAFGEQDLIKIFTRIVEENKMRMNKGIKPLYVMYDQIYWMLSYGATTHFNPVTLIPEMRDYTIFVDGISKVLASTGIRVGWGFGPSGVIDKMKSFISHMGAFAPKAEQIAVAEYLNETNEVNKYIEWIKATINSKLLKIYNGITALKSKGYKVDSIAPQGAIYLTVQFDLHGFKTPSGKALNSTGDITTYLMNEAQLGLVPFYAFGSNQESTWYRLSVGTCRDDDIPVVMEKLEAALSKLS
ncbi:MAG: aminotransferase [Ignavibacteriales bacterium UTCHB1]|nr:aminotransferase class I/II-fold pyridoxal phosphate-dependent enzyme [Ignavibacteria bacterium]OQY78158.1 MAG: aminotransferase [Ignavibacteriales bacterium UTCHB1]